MVLDLPDGWTNSANVLLAGAVCCWGFSIGHVVSLVVHECGHALAASMVGYSVRLVSIGKGTIRFRRRIGRCWLVVRAEPIYGVTARLPDPKGRRGAQAVYAAGGPIASALLIAGAAIAMLRLYDDEILMFSGFFLGVVLVASMHLVGALRPMTIKLNGRAGLRRTDGLQLLTLARGGEIDAFDARYKTLLLTELDEAEAASPPSALAPELLYQLGRGDLAEAWAQTDVADVIIRGLLCDPALSHTERLFIYRFFKLHEALDTAQD